MPYRPFDLSGKVTLVTGGNSGIGLGFANALAQAGADIAIWGTNTAKNQAAREQVAAHGGKVIALQCDVSDKAQVDASFAKTVEELGKVDSCFANAGIGSRGTPFLEMSTDEWRDIFAVNMEGVFFTFQAAIKHMVERGEGGSLVVTSSSSAIFGAPRSEHYASTKAGVNAMVRGLAVEHARHGIRANAILPGWIETAMTARAFSNEKFVNAVLRRVPQRRWGVGDDFGGIAVYLASDASAYHSGDSMVIDGAYACF